MRNVITLFNDVEQNYFFGVHYKNIKAVDKIDHSNTCTGCMFYTGMTSQIDRSYYWCKFGDNHEHILRLFKLVGYRCGAHYKIFVIKDGKND